jgi:hypothetical protein
MYEAPASPDASSADAAKGPFAGSNPEPSTRHGQFDGHLPDLVEPLLSPGIEDSFTESRRLRRNGWTPERKRRFLEELSESGIFLEACRAVGISSRAAYNLCDRDTLFAAGCDAAAAMTRRRLADDVYTRSVNGCVERIYKDGVIVAERHRYDNRLSMAVLHRLDARLDRARERGDRHLNAMRNWDDYLDALGEDRREDGMAILSPPEPEPESAPAQNARSCELHELSLVERNAIEVEDRHDVWEDDGGTWWTDYPPPAGLRRRAGGGLRRAEISPHPQRSRAGGGRGRRGYRPRASRSPKGPLFRVQARAARRQRSGCEATVSRRRSRRGPADGWRSQPDRRRAGRPAR